MHKNPKLAEDVDGPDGSEDRNNRDVALVRLSEGPVHEVSVAN